MKSYPVIKGLFPCKSKDYFLNGFSVKTIVLVGIYNQQFQGTIILMVFDFQGFHKPLIRIPINQSIYPPGNDHISPPSRRFSVDDFQVVYVFSFPGEWNVM